MKLKLITTWTCLIALLLISSFAYATVPVSIGPAGVTFPDNSVQSTAATLPACVSGEVIVNNLGSWLCGSILPVDKGIATCVLSVCSISACQPGWGSCDNNVLNGCEAPLTTTQNCGGCGISCGVDQICSVGACVTSPNAPGAVVLAASPTSGVTNNNVPVTLTATVSPAGVGGTIANGTVVTFTIVSGTGSLSSLTALTTSGVASVTLNSLVVGSVGVTASAGTSLVTSNTVNVPFIAQPTQAIILLQTVGTIPVTNPITTIGSIQTDVDFSTNKGLTFVSANLSGPVTSSGQNNAVDTFGDPVPPITKSFMAANLFATGKARLGVINVAATQDTAAFALISTTGRFATVRFSIAAGKFPTAADFTLSNIAVDIPGITVEILSVTIQ